MRNPFSPRWFATILLVVFLAGPCFSQADSSVLEESIESRVEDLRRQIEEFLAEVPEGLRDEVRRRLLDDAFPAENSDIAVPLATQEPLATEELGDAAQTTSPEGIIAESARPAPTVTPRGTTPPTVAPPDTTSMASESIIAEGTAESAPSKAPTQWRRRRCNTLDLFDENADGRITSLDRDWRYFYLWVDKNQDGRVEEGEFESTYALGVREIALHLETFVRKKKGGIGEIRSKETIVFDLRGNGFGADGSARQRPDDGALSIDATALLRGGGLQLFSAEGEKIEGIQPFRKGWKAHAEGTVVELSCP